MSAADGGAARVVEIAAQTRAPRRMSCGAPSSRGQEGHLVADERRIGEDLDEVWLLRALSGLGAHAAERLHGHLHKQES